MAIQVYCECGNAMSVRPELGGKKVKCKACGVVLRIPEVPLDESAEAPPPKDGARAEPVAAPGADYEVVKEGESPPKVCPACGANCAPDDTACLACGAELGGGGAGLLSKVPRPVLFGVVGLVGFGLLALVANSLWTASRPASYTQDGLAHLKTGDHGAARRAFESALKYDKDYAAAIVGMAEVGVAAKDDRLLEQYATKAFAVTEDSHQRARLRLAYARARLAAGDYKSARNQAVDAKEENPDLEGVARGIIGLSALMAEQKDEALAELRYAATQRSDDWRVYKELAVLLRDKGELVEARTNAEQSVKLKDDDAALWLMLGDLRHATDDVEGAKQAFQRAARVDDANAQAHARLARIYLDEKDLAQAETEGRRACDLAPDDLQARVGMGRILLALEQPKAAQEELEKALKLGSSWEAEFLLGRALIETKDVAGGTRRLQSALDKRPDDLPLHLEAARLAIEAGDGAAAVACLGRVAGKHDDSYDLHLLYARALATQSGRNERELVDRLKRAMDLDPSRREAPAMLGKHLLDKLESEAAIEVLTRGLSRNPQDKEMLFLKGRACIRARKWDDAIESLQLLRSLDRAYPEVEDWLRRAEQGKFYGE
jgi:tetratricopeptide (TPR) repeat protein